MKNKIIKFLALLIVLMCSAFTLFAVEKDYKIGDTGPGGGIVFYKNASGFTVEDGSGNSVECHYLEVSKEDLGCVCWNSDLKSFSDLFSYYGIGEGKAATVKILETVKTKASAENSAAYLCSKYKTSTTKAGDWYLPTSDELRVLFKNLTLDKMKITNTEFYWSSSLEGNKVWARKNKTSTIDSVEKKFMVRAVHAF